MLSSKLDINKKILYSAFFIFPFGFITGPFLSDFLLSIFGIYFLYLTLKLNLFHYYNNLFFKFSILFFLFLIFSGLLSNDIYSSLIDFGGPIFYFRNFIFIIGIIYFFKSDIKYINILYISFLFVISFVMFDAFFLLIFGFNLFNMRTIDVNRLTGIFGEEQILGHFLSYSFPILFTLYLLIKKQNKINYFFIFLFSLFVLLIAFISGDRTGFLKLSLFIFFVGILITEYRKFLIIFFIFLFGIIFAFININEKSSIRFNNTIDDISNNKTFLPISPGHEDLFLSGYNLFKDYPIIGAGPQMYRVLCNTNPNYNINYTCTSHVHNYYFQTMGELGIIGLFFLILLYLYLIRNIYEYFKYSKKNYPLMVINIHLLISFLPIISHFNFYNNWVNPLIALAFAIFLFLIQKKDVT